MKTKPLPIAGLLLLSAAANAQNSVTLYGIVDQGIDYVTNAGGHNLIEARSGVIQASRWGLRGNEDLGGGLSAIFTLENGFDGFTGKSGQGGLEFGRQAFAGISSPWGTVTLGRQYDSVVDYVGILESGDQWAGYIGNHPGDLDNMNNFRRMNNTIKYASSIFSGLQFGVTYSLGGVAGDISRNEMWSAGVRYSNGPFLFGLGYMNVRNPNTSLFGGDGNAGPATTNNMSLSPVYSGLSSARSYEVLAAGGAYTVGAATVGATYSNTRFSNLGDTSSGPNPLHYTGTAAFNNAEINFKYMLTPSLLMGVSLDYTDGGSVNGSGGAKYRQLDVGADYFLSTRTDVYFEGVYQKASGTDSTGQSAVAAITLLTASSNSKQAIARIGLRHRF